MAGLAHLPVGVVARQNWQPRLIVDYTFTSVNPATIKLVPPEAMQFGRALQKVFSKIVHADPTYGPVWLVKIDIADGLYCMRVQSRTFPSWALPSQWHRVSLLWWPFHWHSPWAGWRAHVESPPYFTTFTETSCDLANAMLRESRVPSQEHRLECVAATPSPESLQFVLVPRRWASSQAAFGSRPHRPPLAAVDVYVDDFLLLSQTRPTAVKVMRLALHAIDAVMRPLSRHDPAVRKEPASVKKLLQGDANWSTQKTILGWNLDTVAGTVSLLPHRLDRLYELLRLVRPPRKRFAVPQWHQIFGELQSMVIALPGARGLFSVLQDALGCADKHRIRLNRHVFAAIEDFTLIADSLQSRPTRLMELVPLTPPNIGACDECRQEMGGVSFDALDPAAPPVVWRQQFPAAIQRDLVTSDHRDGTVSISDLELTGLIVHRGFLPHHRHVHERTMCWISGDNCAALSWANKGSSTSTSACSYLLRLSALHEETRVLLCGAPSLHPGASQCNGGRCEPHVALD
jgi:hypothetical protein